MNNNRIILFIFFFILTSQIVGQSSFENKPNSIFSFIKNSVIACNVTADAGNDILVCEGDFPVQLNGSFSGNEQSFSWVTSPDLDDETILNPMVSAPGTYTLTVQAIDDANIVTNGDFENGDTGFTSDYSTGVANFGNYLVTDNPQNYFGLLSPCADHTTGTGNLMVVDGSPNITDDIWCQIITLNANTDYYFSMWGTMVGSNSAAELFFTVNGVSINSTTTLPLTNCDWTEISTVWNSQSNTTIEVCIRNNNISTFGNDFAIDDIFIAPICEVTDEVEVGLLEAIADVSNATIPCEGDCVVLDGSASTQGGGVTFEWSSPTGGTIQDGNTLMPTVCEIGTYKLKISNFDSNFNLTCEDSIEVTVDLGLPDPITPSFDGPTVVCDGTTTSYNITSTDINVTDFEWQVTGGTISSGQGTSIIDVDWGTGTMGEVCVFSENSCSQSLTVCSNIVIDSIPEPPVILGSPNICNNAIADYEFVPTPDISSIIWTVPAGATIQSGQGMSLITVDWGSVQGGDVCLEIENNCGTNSDCLTVVFGNVATDIIFQNPLCVGDDNGFIKIIPTSGTAPFSFNWSGGDVVDSIGMLVAGTYQVTISDSGGCSSEESITLVDPQLLEVDFSITPITCHDACDGIITALAMGGTGMYSYSWANDSSVDDNLSNLCEGTYTVTVTDENGCTVEGQTTLQNPILISATLSQDTTICAGTSADLQVNFTGVGPFDITLSNGDSFSNLNDGDIINIFPTTNSTITFSNITDQGQSNCAGTSNSSVEITVDNLPDLPVISGDLNLCESIVTNYCMTNISNVDSFFWQIPLDASFTGQDSDCIEIDWSGSMGGQVCVEAINECGSIQSCINVVVFPIPTSTFTFDPVICINGNAVINYNGTASPSATFNWDFGSGTILSGTGGGPYEIQWATGGSQTVSLTVEENGCTSSSTSEIILVDEPIPNPVINCTSTTSSVTFTWNDVAGATSYLVNDISGNGGMIIGNSYIVSGLSNGEIVTIELTAIGNNACGNTTVQTSCSADNCPSVLVEIEHVDPLCLTPNSLPFDLNVIVTGGSGSGNFNWLGDGISDSNSSTFDPVLAGVGIHDVTVEYTENNCTYTDVISIGIFATPTSDFIAEGVICITDNSTVTYQGTATSNANYTWDFDGGTIISGNGQGPFEINWAAVGSYNITLTVEENGCTSDIFSQTVQVDSEIPAPVVTCTSTTQSVIFSWDNIPGVSSFSVSDISGPAGIQNGNSYEVTGLSNGEIVSIEVTAIGNSACGNTTVQVSCSADNCPQTSVDINPVPITCFNSSTGTFDMTAVVTGGNGSGTIVWSGNGIVDSNTGTFDPQISGIGNHNITCTYTQDNCSSSDVFNVEIVQTPTSDFTIENNICVNQNTNVTYLGNATSNATYTWDFDGGTIISGNGQGPFEINWSSAGNYNITLTVEENGCTSDIFTQAIQVDPELSVPVVNCNSTTQSVTFLWDDIAGVSDFMIIDISGPSGIQIGNSYEVSGLSTSQEVTIEITAVGNSLCGNTTIQAICAANNCPMIVVDVDPVSPICLTNSILPFDLSAIVSGGNNSGSMAWSGDGITDSMQGTFDPQIVGAGTHNITCTYSQDNCDFTDVLTIEIFETPSADFSADGVICISGNANVSYLGNATSNANYTWNFDGGTTISGSGQGPFEINWAAAGSYNITLTVEENGCVSDVLTQAIQVDPELGAPDVSCTTTPQSIIFSWGNIAGVSDFQINELSGIAGVQNGNSYEFTNLNPNQEVSIEVTALGNSICGNTTTVSTCTANNCPNIMLAVSPIDDICLDDMTDEIPLEVMINGSDGSGIGTWSGNGVVNGVFDPKISGEGVHEIIYTFEEVSCEFSESIFVNVNLQPEANAGQGNHLDCNLVEVNLDGSNSTPFGNMTWTTDVGNILSGENSLAPLVNTAGTYFLHIENLGCESSAEVVITQNVETPIADAGTEKLITCDESCVIIGGNNSSQGNTISYSWTGPNGFVSDEMTPEVCEQGEYILTVFDSGNGCVSTPSQIMVLENTTLPIAAIQSFGNLDCVTSSVVLDGSVSSTGNNFSYQWYDLNGMISNSNNSVLETSLEGMFYLQVTNTATGCISMDSFLVNDLTTFPLAEIQEPEVLTCVVTELTLDGLNSSSSPTIVYTWSGPPNGVSSGGDSNSPNITLPGIYQMNLLDTSNGCTATASIHVFQNITSPVADAGQDIEFECNEFEATLGNENTSSGSNFIYQWTSSNPNSVISNPSILNPTITGLGNYTLTVLDLENGCVAFDEAVVSQSQNIPQTINLESFNSICHGDDNGMISIESVSGGTSPYLFSFNQSPFSNQLIYNNLSPANYNITVQDANGCELSTSVLLTEPELLSIDLGEDIYLELGDSVQLEATTTGIFDTAIWQSSYDFSSCDFVPFCWNPIVTPLNTTNVSAMILDENGCIAEDDLTIFVEKKRFVFIPNAFAPDGHEDNQVFMIYGGKDVRKIHKFRIFSRWGDTLFEAYNFEPNDRNVGWDGTFNGKKMNPGVFVYFAEIEFIDGYKIIYKGDVTLTK